MEFYKIWHDEEYDDLDTLYPLKYFIGHQYRFKNTDPDDKQSIFPTDYLTKFGTLFEADDLQKMNDLIRRHFNPYLVRKELYTDELGDIKTYTLYNIRQEVEAISKLHEEEWLVIKKIAEWYNDGAIDKTLVNNFFIKRDDENYDIESGEVHDEGSRGATQQNPYVTEKAYGTGADARTTTDTKSGKIKETGTGSRKPNESGTAWVEQNKNVNETEYPSTDPYKTETKEEGKEYIKTYGELKTELTRTFGEDGHRFDRVIDSTIKGFRNHDLTRILPEMFERGGMEWLHLVVHDLMKEIIYWVLPV